jgi:hypothetical protein
MAPPGGLTLAEALAQRAQGIGRPVPAGTGQGVFVQAQPRPAQARPLASTLGAHAAPEKVSFPLGSLYNHVVPLGAVTMFSHEDAKLPNEDLYDPNVSPQTPFTFDVATYQVPRNMVLLVLGYSFSASRHGGVDIYDTQPLEPGRMKQSWIWDLNVSGTRQQRNTSFQIVPTPIVQNGAGNGIPQAVAQNGFSSVQAKLAQSIGGAGLGGLPFDGREYGPDNAPFSLRVDQGQSVAIRCSVIRPLSVPLASISGRVDGFLFPITLLDAYEDLIQP